MDLPLRERSKARRKTSVGAVRRRHVIYVAGYEPRGAKGYRKLFERECDRFQRVWPASLTIAPTDFDSEDFARWRVDVRASHWRVSTTYDFLRLVRFIRAGLNEPLVRHIARALLGHRRPRERRAISHLSRVVALWPAPLVRSIGAAGLVGIRRRDRGDG